MGYVTVAVLAVAIAVFAMQNTASVSLRFLVWQLETVPLAAVVLISVAAGLVIAGVPMWFRLWRLRSQLRRAGSAAPPEQPTPPTARP